jgi:hypothetical protein
MRRRQESFLAHLIEKYQGDNVPLSQELCFRYCGLHEVTGKKCKALCRGERAALSAAHCAKWQIDTLRHSKYDYNQCNDTGKEGDNMGDREVAATIQVIPRPAAMAVSWGKKRFRRQEIKSEEAVKNTMTTTKETWFPSSFHISVPVHGEVMERGLRGRRQPNDCDTLTCVTNTWQTATVCLNLINPPEELEDGEGEGSGEGSGLRPEVLKKSKE